jgi:hypothetical protein
VRRDERQAADFEQLGRREEDHLGWKAVNRVDEHTLLEDLVVELVLLAGDCRRQSGRTCTDDENVSNGHIHTF